MPEEAAGFYEDDEDPAEVFARFDAGPHVVTARTRYSAADQVRCGMDYIRTTYGGGAVTTERGKRGTGQ